MNLDEYFEKYMVNESAFAKKLGVSRTALRNYRNGNLPRLDRAYLIQELTNGLVTATMEDWPTKQKAQTKNKKKNHKE